MRAILVVVMLMTLAAHAGDEAGSKKELKLLEGSWDVVAVEIDGDIVAPEKAPKKITISGNKLRGLGPEMTIVRVDPTKKPKWMDLSFKREKKEHTVQAIYEFDGTFLKLCLPLAQAKGKEKRPESFESTQGGLGLFKAKRAN